MSDLITFLRARLDEDEAAAKAAWGIEWDWRDVAHPFGERPSIAHTAHIARHDPARVLREVEAKRAILTLKDILRPLAGVYSDHPDYRAEWAVKP